MFLGLLPWMPLTSAFAFWCLWHVAVSCQMTSACLWMAAWLLVGLVMFLLSLDMLYSSLPPKNYSWEKILEQYNLGDWINPSVCSFYIMSLRHFLKSKLLWCVFIGCFFLTVSIHSKATWNSLWIDIDFFLSQYCLFSKLLCSMLKIVICER